MDEVLGLGRKGKGKDTVVVVREASEERRNEEDDADGEREE
jgi:hypothetical protein